MGERFCVIPYSPDRRAITSTEVEVPQDRTRLAYIDSAYAWRHDRSRRPPEHARPPGRRRGGRLARESGPRRLLGPLRDAVQPRPRGRRPRTLRLGEFGGFRHPHETRDLGTGSLTFLLSP